MRILVLAVQRRLPADLAARIRDRAELADEVELELVTVFPTRLEGFVQISAVDPSLVPGRPLILTQSVSGDSPRAALPMRGLRLARRLRARVPVRNSARATPQNFLAVACATSSALHHRAREADAVVVFDGPACLGAWRLAKKVPDTPIVFRAVNLRRVLSGLDRPLPPKPRIGELRAPAGRAEPAAFPAVPDPSATSRLLIAPANYAGQAHAWAESVRRHVPDATATNFRAGDLKNPFASDYSVSSLTFAQDLGWRIGWRAHVEASYTHVLLEAGRPIFGVIAGRGDQSVRELTHAGKQVGLVSHGTDARIPSVHSANERWHPYDALPASQVRQMEVNAHANVELYRSHEGPVFVSTPGLLEFVPSATWLPVVVRPELWHREDEPMVRDVPVVAHVPSGPQKGSHMIDPILSGLAERGLIEYRRLQDVPFAKMPKLYGTADIVVEQFGIADYSTAACEAMAAGRVVVSRVADGVREHVRSETGLELPIVEANPESLESVILELVGERARAREIAARGRVFVDTVHDGRYSARVLRGWLTP